MFNHFISALLLSAAFFIPTAHAQFGDIREAALRDALRSEQVDKDLQAYGVIKSVLLGLLDDSNNGPIEYRVEQIKHLLKMALNPPAGTPSEIALPKKDREKVQSLSDKIGKLYDKTPELDVLGIFAQVRGTGEYPTISGGPEPMTSTREYQVIDESEIRLQPSSTKRTETDGLQMGASGFPK